MKADALSEPMIQNFRMLKSSLGSVPGHGSAYGTRFLDESHDNPPFLALAVMGSKGPIQASPPQDLLATGR